VVPTRGIWDLMCQHLNTQQTFDYFIILLGTNWMLYTIITYIAYKTLDKIDHNGTVKVLQFHKKYLGIYSALL